MEKSYVSMATCPICKEANGSILMDRRLKPTLDRTTPTIEPCEKCKEKYLTNGTMLLGKESRESNEIIGLMVISDEAFKGIFGNDPPKDKTIFADIRVLRDIEQRVKQS